MPGPPGLRSPAQRYLLVSVGMVPHPAPGVGDHGLQLRLLRLPTQLHPYLLAGGHKDRGIPRTPGRLHRLYAPPRYSPSSLYYLQDGETRPVAKIVDAVLSRLRPSECQEMGTSEVLDVDLVADSAGVGRRVVRAEDLHRAPLPCRPEHERDEVGLGLVGLSETSAGTGDVKVAQAGSRQTPRLRYRPDHPVHRKLRCPVGVARQRRGHLRDGNLLGLPVDGGRRGEHKPLYSSLTHRFEQVEGSADVVAVVALGLLDGLAHQREGGEVQDAVEASGEDDFQPFCVEKVGLDEAGLFGDGPLVSFREVVQDGCLVARFDELVGDHAPDVACPARDQELHVVALSTASLSVPAVASGRASTMYAPAPVSLPARYFSLSAVRLGG